MDKDLADFAVQWARVVAMTMIPVVLTTFLSVPMSLGRYPGEPLPVAAYADRHMT